MINISTKLYKRLTFLMATLLILTSATSKEASICLEEKIKKQIYIYTNTDAIYHFYYTISIDKDSVGVVNINKRELDETEKNLNSQIIKIVKDNITTCLIKSRKRVHICLDTSQAGVLVEVRM